MRDEIIVNNITERANYEELNPAKWVDEYADYLYNFALKRLNDEALAQDLVQDTFLSALEKSNLFRAESSIRSWLTAILKNKIVDTYRKRANALSGEMRIGSVEDEPEFFDPDLNNWKKKHWPAPFGVEDEDALHNKEFMNVLRKCLFKLPSLWMSVFKLKHLDEEETGFICEKLRITSANYWVIIHRAKVNLRSCLQKNWM
ncbi:sigma-70 family RNA polymerase sigma factor [Mucilaginibacter sp. SG564]|uniref:sigma-70 family RNA polymerase sigma factor n=1 Tax=Mucilaginibacter sp. SG564 TaxID=2587022 RepID=UPI001551B967|nr:sigma-70 family RNA polymerase sigma factor [Mucilaginibacter sp. SG564]NOW96072.1 RNA polymerase sigma-70 factor (ECF subfamily) [Mucilaginibacter sp. SG564]